MVKAKSSGPGVDPDPNGWKSAYVEIAKDVVANFETVLYVEVPKYDSEGKIEWAKGIYGTSMDEINSVEGCSDGGYIVVGSFSSSSIDLGNGTRLTNKGNGN